MSAHFRSRFGSRSSGEHAVEESMGSGCSKPSDQPGRGPGRRVYPEAVVPEASVPPESWLAYLSVRNFL